MKVIFTILFLITGFSCAQKTLKGDGSKQDNKIIQEIIKDSHDDMVQCSVDYFRRGNEREGVIMATFNIVKKGMIIGIHFDRKFEEQLSQCLEKIIKEMEFPEVIRKTKIEVRIPLKIYR